MDLTIHTVHYRGYVRRYFDVQNRAFLHSFMRDLCDFLSSMGNYALLTKQNTIDAKIANFLRKICAIFRLHVQNRAPHGLTLSLHYKAKTFQIHGQFTVNIQPNTPTELSYFSRILIGPGL